MSESNQFNLTQVELMQAIKKTIEGNRIVSLKCRVSDLLLLVRCIQYFIDTQSVEQINSNYGEIDSLLFLKELMIKTVQVQSDFFHQ